MTPEERADAVMEEYGCPGISIRTLIADAIRTAEQEAVEPYRKVVEAGRIAFKACQEAVDDKRTAEGACLIAQAELGEALRSLLPGADKPATQPAVVSVDEMFCGKCKHYTFYETGLMMVCGISGGMQVHKDTLCNRVFNYEPATKQEQKTDYKQEGK